MRICSHCASRFLSHAFPCLLPTPCTQDLLLPEEGQGFVTHRVPLRDVEEEDLAPHLPGERGLVDCRLAVFHHLVGGGSRKGC